MALPFWSYIKKHKKILFFALVLATINQVFSLLDPQIFRLLIDNYASKVGELTRADFLKGVVLLLLAFIGVAFVSRVAKNIQDYYVSVISQRVGAGMYEKSVDHTFSLPFVVFEDRRSGEILGKLQKARSDSQTLIENFINIVFLSLVGILFVVIYAFYVNWLIGVSYFLLVPIVGTFTFVLSRKIKAAQKDIVKETAELAGSTTETLRNVELVKSLGLEKQEIKRLNKVNEKILNLELSKIKMIRKLSFLQGTLVNAMRAILTFIMLWLILEGSISLGEFFSLFIYSFFIFSPLASFGTVASQYQEARASNEQLEEILNLPPEKEPKDAIELGILESVSFKDVEFHYNGSDVPSISEINLSARAGETIALVGPSGSGKSTLIKLIVGLYKPDKGKLLLNGVSSNEINYNAVRRKIGFVSQETQLFAGTIKENLLFVNPEASDKDCLKVLELASILHILERGNNGLDTKIGEGGIKLSGGERQRLAIARALLRSPELLIFDEATSSLDSLTEKEITSTIRKILDSRPNLITIIVAHRLSTVSHADKIYVLEKGKIVEEGNHNNLLKKEGLYAALWREQGRGL